MYCRLNRDNQSEGSQHPTGSRRSVESDSSAPHGPRAHSNDSDNVEKNAPKLSYIDDSILEDLKFLFCESSESSSQDMSKKSDDTSVKAPTNIPWPPIHESEKYISSMHRKSAKGLAARHINQNTKQCLSNSFQDASDRSAALQRRKQLSARLSSTNMKVFFPKNKQLIIITIGAGALILGTICTTEAWNRYHTKRKQQTILINNALRLQHEYEINHAVWGDGPNNDGLLIPE